MKTISRNFAFAAALAALCGVSGAQAGTIVLISDGNTLATSLSVSDSRLTSGDVSGLSWTNATADSLGTFTSVPAGASAGTKVINISAGGDASGFFELTFTLPSNYTAASISGAANIDDEGFVFLNGHAIGSATEYGDSAFTSSSYFQSGVNTFVVSDINSGGGPSGAAFYANIAYSATPEPGTWIMMIAGFGLLGMALRRRPLTSFA